MENKKDNRQQQIRALLAVPDGLPPDALGPHMLAPWRSLSSHLSPLVGETGFGALFGRAVRLTAPEHAWLAGTASPASVDALLDMLGDKLASVEAAKAAAGNAALLAAYTTLLSALIGDALTTRLLDSAWPAGTSEKHAGEQN